MPRNGNRAHAEFVTIGSPRAGIRVAGSVQGPVRGLFVPPLVLLVTLTVCALVLNGGRLGLDLAGGSLLPVGDLGSVWSTYLQSWHAVAGGTAGAAPAALAVLGLLGAPLTPIGGPAALVALLLIGDVPLAALSAYAATRRLDVGRWVRAGLAAAYGLLPAATAGVAQGRLDVLVVHLLLPVLLAGIVAVLTRPGARWLSASVLCALGLAVVGAFSPLAAALALAGLLIGFVVLPSPAHGMARGVLAVVTVVVLPLLLLLPWVPALLTHPGLFLHGPAGPAPVQPAIGDLAGLAPGGLPVGIGVVGTALVAVIVRPTRRAVPGLAVLVLGIAGVVLVQSVRVVPLRGGAPAPGFVGVPLLFIGAGLLAVVLATCMPDRRSVALPLARIGTVGTVALLLALGIGAVTEGRDGPLRASGSLRLAPSLNAELADTGYGVLVLGDVVRQTAGRTPAFGDDAFVPVPGATDRLGRWQRDLLAGSRDGLTSAAMAGVRFVVLPPGESGGRLRRAAPDLVSSTLPAGDGRQVVRLAPTSGPVTLVSLEQARRAVEGQPPSVELMNGTAVAPVDARLPEVRIRVSDGPVGRLLVLAAGYEPGWRAGVDGEPVPIVPAWGHQVAVPVPARQSEVVVEYPSTTHHLLLLVQVAALLFTALTAVPGSRTGTAGPRR